MSTELFRYLLRYLLCMTPSLSSGRRQQCQDPGC